MTEQENLIEQLKQEPDQQKSRINYFFLVNENPVAAMLKWLHYPVIIIDEKHLSITEFETIISELQPGTTYILDYIFLTCLTKKENEELQEFLKQEGLHYKEQAWRLFYRKEYLKDPNNTKELEKAIKEFAKEDKLASYDSNLMRFHHWNSKGEPIAVFDFKIFEYIKETYPLFVCSGSVYLYQHGVYLRDSDGTQIKEIIRNCLYEPFKKARIINQVYTLIFEAHEFRRKLFEINQYPKSYINFQDSMLDVKTMQTFPHDPKYFSINQVPYRYEDIEKASEGIEIENFFQFIFSASDDRQMLLEYAGLCLTTDTSQQRFLTLCGLGGTGKSVLIQLLETAAGIQNVSNVSMQELSKRFSTSLLVGKTLNSCADLSMEALEDSSTIKKLLGEDSLMAEFKGQNAFMFKNYSKLLFSTNMLPVITTERTNGFYRRLLILKIDKQPEKPDTELADKLIKEIHYFLKLAIQALHEMYQRGIITISENSIRAVAQMRKDSDVVQAWIDDCCITGEDLRIERTVAYESFKKYCEEEERQSLTRNGLFKALRTKNFIETKDTKGTRYFYGILNEKNITNDKFIKMTNEQFPFKK